MRECVRDRDLKDKWDEKVDGSVREEGSKGQVG
ncbi:hypothetical protein BkAM31D_22090 [Halalkalibacter krulwichiae]|uniref:Uncharacterized protein n=1 Tax=Halalkalibacter krulwichiae TaxID=199441 RepID=A0A1X9MFV4_9BACI|nr:hypothetical protein BkAM31D_22090 [Halalkalibacter krulwichiae]